MVRVIVFCLLWSLLPLAASCSGGSDAPHDTQSPNYDNPVLPQAIVFGDFTPGPIIEGIRPLAGQSLLANPNESVVDQTDRLSDDAQRVVDLYAFQIALEQFRASSGQYPTELSDVLPTYAQRENGVSWTTLPSDPVSRAEYSYRTATGRQSYSLAATMSSGAEFSLTGPAATLSRLGSDSGIQHVAAISYRPGGRLLSLSADAQVQVDNSVGLKASEGEVVRGEPSNARIGVRNLHKFWTNVTPQVASGNVSVAPSPFNGGDIGGLYAALGAIAPEGKAVWDGSFEPASSQAFVTTPSIAGGSYKAGVLNILTFISAALAKTPTAGSLQTIVSAIDTAQKSPDLIGAAQALEDRDFGAFVKHFYKMLSDDNQRKLIGLALKQLGIEATDAALKKLTLVFTIFELGRMAFDEIYSLVEGTLAGQVTFRLEALPQPRDADVFAYCSRVGTVDQPSVFDLYEESVRGFLTNRLGHAPSGTSVPWRCMDGSVWACDFGANLPCGAADTSREPTQEMRDYCAREPEGGIPFYITGHGSLYSWGCQAGVPYVLGQQYETDSRGFVSQYWYRLDPSGVHPAPQTGIATGAWVEVRGTGSCLNVRESPSTSAATKRCIKDATVVEIQSGPVEADGYRWWKLGGTVPVIQDSWAAETYLVPITTFLTVTNAAPASDPFRVIGFGPSLDSTAPTTNGFTIQFSETPDPGNFNYEIQPNVSLNLTLNGNTLFVACSCWNYAVGSDGQGDPDAATTYRLIIKQGSQNALNSASLTTDVVIQFVARPHGGI